MMMMRRREGGGRGGESHDTPLSCFVILSLLHILALLSCSLQNLLEILHAVSPSGDGERMLMMWMSSEWEQDWMLKCR